MTIVVGWRRCGLACVVALLCLVGGARGNEAADASNEAAVAAVWQHRLAGITYYGITTRYACDALAAQVRRILSYLGARNDLKVTASGCPNGPSVPGRSAWVRADFYTLTRAVAHSQDELSARWVAIEIMPQRPGFIAALDCELIDDMKDLILKNFTWRDVQYSARCIPKTQTLGAFSVEGVALQSNSTHQLPGTQP
jgi:hypothetical protein